MGPSQPIASGPFGAPNQREVQMSIMRCEKHDRSYDSDFKAECPICETTPADGDDVKASCDNCDEVAILQKATSGGTVGYFCPTCIGA